MIYRNIQTQRQLDQKTGSKSVRINGKYVANQLYTFARGAISPPTDGVENISWAEVINDPISTRTNNKLYDKLRQEVSGPKGELLTGAVEWRTSLDMISSRVTQISKAYLAVRRFQFAKAASVLGITTPKRLYKLNRKTAQQRKLSPTSLWLEYWMGWAPLHGDIAHAINTLTAGPQTSTKHFSVGVRQSSSRSNKYGNWTPDASRYIKWIKEFSSESTFSAYGDVTVANHNSNLATQLGFTNPVLTAWQLVPFSFIADWFVNVGQVLGSLTDFAGLTFTNTGRGEKHEVKLSSDRYVGDFYWNYWWDASGSHQTRVYTYTASRQDAFCTYLYRLPGSLPLPRLDIARFDKLSLTRAATSISLLTEIFLRKK